MLHVPLFPLRPGQVLVSYTVFPQLPPHGSAVSTAAGRVCGPPCRRRSLPPRSSPAAILRLVRAAEEVAAAPALPSRGSGRVAGVGAAVAGFSFPSSVWLLKLSSVISCGGACTALVSGLKAGLSSLRQVAWGRQHVLHLCWCHL